MNYTAETQSSRRFFSKHLPLRALRASAVKNPDGEPPRKAIRD